MRPVPSTETPGAWREPASVLTTNVAMTMRRTQRLLVSETKANALSGERRMPVGLKNAARVPMSSPYALTPVPAIVVTAPVATSMRRTRLLCLLMLTREKTRCERATKRKRFSLKTNSHDARVANECKSGVGRKSDAVRMTECRIGAGLVGKAGSSTRTARQQRDVA